MTSIVQNKIYDRTDIRGTIERVVSTFDRFAEPATPFTVTSMNNGGRTIPDSRLTAFDIDRPGTASAVSELMLLMQAVDEHHALCVHSAARELTAKLQNSTPADTTARVEFDAQILDAAAVLDGHRLWIMDEIRNLN